jgi:hypothetical protein
MIGEFMAKPAPVWEKVQNSGETLVVNFTARAKVPGGWLVIYSSGSGTGITFVPDPNHTWQ